MGRRHKAWGGLLCPKLPQRAPRKRHQPHQSKHRDPKKHQRQTGSGFAMCIPRRKAFLLVLSHLLNYYSLSTPPLSKLLLHFPLVFHLLPASPQSSDCAWRPLSYPWHPQCPNTFLALFCPSALALPGCLQKDRLPWIALLSQMESW